MKTTTINNIEEALSELGVSENTLSVAEKKALDEQGFLILQNMIDQTWLKQLQGAFEQWCEQGKITNNTARPETGTRHLNGLYNKGLIFERIYTHPKLLAAVYYILKRDFRLGDLAGRDPLPGYGQQGLHTDWMQLAPGQPFQVVNSFWLLDDFTATSGPTRLVPGSHREYGKIDKRLADPASNHPKQVLAVAPAGSLLIFNSHIWHSGTRNHSQNHRRALQCSFIARENRTYSTKLPSANLEDITPAVRYILGV